MFWGTVAEITPSLLLFAALACMPLVYSRGKREGREEASWDAKAAEVDGRWENWRKERGRHERTPVDLPQLGSQNYKTENRQPPRTDLVQTRTPWISYPPARRSSTTAADLAPVFWAQPGTRVPGHPQAGRDSMDGTMVGGVKPVTTDTGEFRALAEAHTTRYIEDMQRSEAAFRGGLIA